MLAKRFLTNQKTYIKIKRLHECTCRLSIEYLNAMYYDEKQYMNIVALNTNHEKLVLSFMLCWSRC